MFMEGLFVRLQLRRSDITLLARVPSHANHFFPHGSPGAREFLRCCTRRSSSAEAREAKVCWRRRDRKDYQAEHLARSASARPHLVQIIA